MPRRIWNPLRDGSLDTPGPRYHPRGRVTTVPAVTGQAAADPLGEIGGAQWMRLLAAARRAVERAGDVSGAISLSRPTDAERRLVIGMTGNYRSADTKSVRVSLTDIDGALRESVGLGLLAVLTRLHGPVRNRPAERAEEDDARREALADARRRCEEHRSEEWFGAWLDGLVADGTVTRLIRRGEGDLLGHAAEVLRLLPANAMPLPVLSERATGDTKALAGTPLAGLVLRALALRGGMPPARSRREQRALWDQAGVIVDDLASQVLVLNLRTTDDHMVADWLRDAADGGLPFRLTLHQLTVHPVTTTAADIYVCENPAVLRAAAGELAERCATLICTEGQPSAACHRLLAAARGQIRWRGDFDWTGLRTTAAAMARHGAVPWRMGLSDYLAALRAPLAETEPLKGPACASPWEPGLAAAMSDRGRAVMEERLIPVLLEDLRR